jgi:hypothetical protein
MDPESDKIRITRSGRELVSKDFALVGVDARTIKTKKEFFYAINAMLDMNIHNPATSARGEDPVLDEVLEGFPGWD